MPTYNFKNKETGEEWEAFISIAERDELMKDPNIEQVHIGAAQTIRGVNQKPDNAFRDLLKDMKKKNSGFITKSTINTF